MTSARAPRNTSAQPGDRYGVTSRCLGNDHDISVAGSLRDVTLPLRNTKQTYPLQICYEHNMLPLLHTVCLKVLVFFLLLSSPKSYSNITSLSTRFRCQQIQFHCWLPPQVLFSIAQYPQSSALLRKLCMTRHTFINAIPVSYGHAPQ